MDSVEGALWLASQTPNILCYLPPSNLPIFRSAARIWRPGLYAWQAKKSSKLTTKQSLKTPRKQLNLAWPCSEVMAYVFNPEFSGKSNEKGFVYKCKLILHNQIWCRLFTWEPKLNYIFYRMVSNTERVCNSIWWNVATRTKQNFFSQRENETYGSNYNKKSLTAIGAALDCHLRSPPFSKPFSFFCVHLSHYFSIY